MHARQAALTGGAVVVLIWLAATAARAEKDAAIKAQEGDINHWIEYYRKSQQPQPVAPERQTDEEEREKGQHAAPQPVAAETNLPGKLCRSQKTKVKHPSRMHMR